MKNIDQSSLLIAHCSKLIAQSSLLKAHCSKLIAHCSLLVEFGFLLRGAIGVLKPA
jgi:hypothetical protein